MADEKVSLLDLGTPTTSDTGYMVQGGVSKRFSFADFPISNAVQTALNTKQATLVSGTNIKTVNGNSLLGSGDITINSGVWGNITGTLSNQTDLQLELDNKLNTDLSNIGGTLSVGNGGTGLSSIPNGSILATSGGNPLAPVSSTGGSGILRNESGVISWGAITGTGDIVAKTNANMYNPIVSFGTFTNSNLVEPLMNHFARVDCSTGPLYLGQANSYNGKLDFLTATNSNWIRIQAGSIDGNITYTLPTSGPSVNGQVLASTTSGVMSWVSKQDTLVSGTNIKTINGTSLLGSGDITIGGGGSLSWGASINGTSSNGFTFTISDNASGSTYGLYGSISGTQTVGNTLVNLEGGTSNASNTLLNLGTFDNAIALNISMSDVGLTNKSTGRGLNFSGIPTGGFRGINWSSINGKPTESGTIYGIYQGTISDSISGTTYGIYQDKINGNSGNAYGIYQNTLFFGNNYNDRTSVAYGFYQKYVGGIFSGTGTITTYGIYQENVGNFYIGSGSTSYGLYQKYLGGAGGSSYGWYIENLYSSGRGSTTPAKYFSFNNNQSASLTNLTTDTAEILFSRTNTATSGTKSDNFNIFNIKKTSVQNGVGGIFTTTGSVLRLENSASSPEGTLTDTTVVAKLVNNGVGSHINLNANTNGTATNEGDLVYDGTHLYFKPSGTAINLLAPQDLSGYALLSGATFTGNITALNLSGTNTGDQNIFQNIAVSGQTTVSAGSTNGTLTLVAGTNITITTDNTAKTVTINSSGGGGFSWGATASGTSGTGLALTMGNSYGSSGIGQSITIGNTQTNALKAFQINAGTSTASHVLQEINMVNGKGIFINADPTGNASTFGLDIDIDPNNASSNDFWGIRVDVSDNLSTGYDGVGIGILNRTTTADLSNGAGIGLYINQIGVGAGATALYIKGAANQVATTNGLFNMTLNNTQSGATVMQKIDTGTSAQGHIALSILHNNASTSSRGIKIDGSTGSGVGLEIIGGTNVNSRSITAITTIGSSAASSTGDIFYGEYIQTYTGTGNPNKTIAQIKRTWTHNSATASSYAGSILSLVNSFTVTTGSPTDGTVVLNITQDADSTGVPIKISQAAVVSTNFKKLIEGDGITIWKSNGTTPNGNLSGTAGDICLNGTSGQTFYCTGTTNWTGM